MMRRILALSTVTVVCSICWCYGAEQKQSSSSIIGSSEPFKPMNILAVLPMPIYSHSQNFMPAFIELARRGHHITMLSPFPLKEPIPNWEDIVVHNFLDDLNAKRANVDLTAKVNFISQVLGMMTFASTMIDMTLQLEPLIDLYKNDTRKFDLIFMEPQFFQEPLLAFGKKFGAPVIAIFPGWITPDLAYYTGNPVFTATYVPNMFMPSSKHMSFYQRGQNLLSLIIKCSLYNLYYLPKMDSVMRQSFPSDDLPYIGDMLFNVSFTFMDYNEIITYPFPKVNNLIGYLGINTKPTGSLPNDLQEIMDKAEDGVLFFTLCSHMKPSKLRPHVIPSLLHAFSRIPQKVLMKWDDTPLPADLPPNVYTKTWFPQTAILAHKNCKAFLTHTGVHGLIEAVHHAVPVISLPLFADQSFFSKWVVETGFGRALDVETITPEIAQETIADVLLHNYDKYKKTADETSNLLKDVPQPKLDEIVYWVEYVHRTKGARHLRPGSLDLVWYQRFGLDLLAAGLVVTLVPLYLLFKVLRCLVSLCRGKKTPSKESKKVKMTKKDN